MELEFWFRAPLDRCRFSGNFELFTRFDDVKRFWSYRVFCAFILSYGGILYFLYYFSLQLNNIRILGFEADLSSSFLDDCQVGVACTRSTNVLFFTVFVPFIIV